VPPVDRLKPTRAASSDSTFSLMEFMREFPDDAACLNYLWRTRYSEDGETAHCPKCETDRKFKRYKTTQRRQSWTCTACGHHIHPTAGTIFHKSSTSLHLWFYAIYLMTSTKCGIAAKHLGRELGVHYKTAWRMFNKIRNVLMDADGGLVLDTEVEADETFVGGKHPRNRRRKGHPGPESDLTPVFGMVQRGGKVVARVVPDTSRETLLPIVRSFVLPSTLIFTDESPSYPVGLRRYGYRHKRIRHSARVYVSGDVHTQTIEGFFGNVKNGIRGNYHSVSRKWLQGYLNEYAWRYNHRDDPEAMFRLLLARTAA
jgi:transposase